MLLPFLAELSTADRNFWIAVALAGGTLFYLIVRPGKKKKDPLSKPFRPQSLSQQRHTERQMESLLVELSQMSQQVTAQLDTRARKLEVLLQEADEKIATLQQLGAGPSAGVPRPFEMPAEVRPRQGDGVEPSRSVPDRPAPSLSPASSPSPADEMFRSVLDEKPRSTVHDPIYALADQGTPASDIARQLDRPLNEVKLILQLRMARS